MAQQIGKNLINLNLEALNFTMEQRGKYAQQVT